MSATPRVAEGKRIPPRRYLALAALALMLSLGTPAAAQPGDGTLDLSTLRGRLADTTAIGLLQKLRLKHDVEGLVGELAAFHAGRGHEPIESLHGRYRQLLDHVVALIQDGEPELAHDLAASSDRLWNDLADPARFAALSARTAG